MKKDTNPKLVTGGGQMERERTSNIIALGHKGSDGQIVTDHVLCANCPPMTRTQIAELSRKLDEFFKRVMTQ